MSSWQQTQWQQQNRLDTYFDRQEEEEERDRKKERESRKLVEKREGGTAAAQEKVVAWECFVSKVSLSVAAYAYVGIV